MSIKTALEDLEQKWKKPDFQTSYVNVANDEKVYNEFVSQLINESELNNRIQFKIIHFKSKMRRELWHYIGTSNLNKNNAQEQIEARKKELE